MYIGINAPLTNNGKYPDSFKFCFFVCWSVFYNIDMIMIIMINMITKLVGPASPSLLPSLITHHSSFITHLSSVITHHWWQLKLPQMVGHCPNGDPTNEPWGRTMKNKNCPKWWGAAPKEGGQANTNVFLFRVWQLEYTGTQGGLAIH